jgi:hypothetical protein
MEQVMVKGVIGIMTGVYLLLEKNLDQNFKLSISAIILVTV